MQMSDLFGRTLREAPADTEGAGWALLQRAAFARALGSARYAYLPLGQRALAQLAAGLPAPLEGGHAAELELPPFTGARFAAAVRNLAGTDVQSYRQLPVRGRLRGVWQRERGQSRGGPLAASEAPGLFGFMLDATEEAALTAYEQQQEGLVDLLRRCGLPVIVVRDPLAAVVGHTYLHLSSDAADLALVCDGCGYAALADAASFGRPPAEPALPLPLEKIATPHTSTIADLARLLGVPEAATAKAVFLMASADEGEQFVFAVVRGDMDVSARKLAAHLRGIGLRVSALRPATEAEIRATGATPGYASPIGLRHVLVVADELIPLAPNLVAGANEEGYHLLNTNYGRDYTARLVADIAMARPGDGCPVCSRTLRAQAVAVLAESQRLPAEKNAPTFLDASGRSQPIQIGVFQLDLGALLAAVAEAHHDAQGLALPPRAAPFAVHLVSLAGAEAEVAALYRALDQDGIACLWDDRAESAGVKFADADLIGLPLRITLGKRSLQAGGAEFKRRAGSGGPDKWIVGLESAVEVVRQTLAEIEVDIVAGVETYPYGEYLR